MSSPSNFALKESHVEVENSYYLVDNTENLSQLDMASLIEQEFTRIVENFYVSEDRMVKRIIYKEMKNAFEIGTKPALLVIDTGGVAMFDAKGQIMTSFRNDKEDIGVIGIDQLYRPMSLPTPAEKAQLESEGATITEMGEGKLKIEIDGDKMVYNGKRMYSEMFFYSEEGDLEGKEQTVFEELPTGQTVMKRRTNIHYVTLPSGACAEYVQKTIYTNYQFDDRRIESRSKRMEMPSQAAHFVISPNPIDDYIFIDYAQIFDESERLDFAIYSLEGHLIKQLKVLNSGSLEIPVDELKAGVYLMKIKDDGGKRIVKKFVKL